MAGKKLAFTRSENTRSNQTNASVLLPACSGRLRDWFRTASLGFDSFKNPNPI